MIRNETLATMFARNMEAKRKAEEAYRDYPRGPIEEYIKPARVHRWDKEYREQVDKGNTDW